MANTFTSNYDFVKSEIGGDNQAWGNNLHTTLDLADGALAKKLEDRIISGITSTAIKIQAGSGTGIIYTDTNEKYFESIVIGDKVRITTNSATNAENGTPTTPVIYTVSAKTNADSITVDEQMVNDTSSEVTIAKVLETVHIDSGPIVCAPFQNITNFATRGLGGTAAPGSDETHALIASGDVTLGTGLSYDLLTISARIVGDLIPSADGSHDLGSDALQWEDLWINGTANIDSLVADTAAISGGSITGGTGSFTTLAVTTGTTIPMNGYTIGTNAKQNRTISQNAPSGSATNGDIWYEVE